MKVNISKDDIVKISNLVRLDLDSDKIEIFRENISDIINYLDSIDSIDTSSQESFFEVNDIENSFREDNILDPDDFDFICENAIDMENGYFKVKKVL